MRGRSGCVSWAQKVEKLMRLANILPGGGGWRKNRLIRLSCLFIGCGGWPVKNVGDGG